jgi:hypothetical protein
MWLERHLNAKGQFRALWVDIQIAREQPSPTLAFRTVLGVLDDACARAHPDVPQLGRPQIEELLSDPATALNRYFSRLSAQGGRPWVVFFDEADGLVGEAMVSFLTQLRRGYIARDTTPFPASIMLVGQRQVRDYALREEERRALSWLGTTSPFNITAEAMTIGPFTEAEVGELLEQHTRVTRQRFEPEAVARIYELGQGHPWLTNALADQIVDQDVRDRSIPVTAAHVDAAKETIILARRSHIDSLIARLREPRVRRILEPMFKGDRPQGDLLDDDIAYVVGLGLVRLREGALEIANPIYREVIPRALTFSQQVTIANNPAWYVCNDGSLDMPKLMADWQELWREDGHLAVEGFSYKESGPHLMLMAFLQRIINGGGRIEREYGLGRGALDLLLYWKNERHVIEVKVRRDKRTEGRALDQLARYLDGVGLGEGWLVLFDLRKKPRWEQKLFTREVTRGGKRIRIIGC